MKLGLTINRFATEKVDYTTTHLALAATNAGHEVWYIEVDALVLREDDKVYAHARSVGDERHRSTRRYMERLRGPHALQQEICVSELDVLFLRHDPAEDAVARPWARTAGIDFGRLARRDGVLVVNDPDGLALGLNKLYMEYFPPEVRPRTLVTRDKSEIKDFISAQGGYAVLKPLVGSGGHNVFLVRPHDTPNINQMIEAIASEGFVIAQEFLPQAFHGDTRLFLLDGEPFQYHGKYCAIHRMRRTGDADIRSNITAGAVAHRATVTPEMLHLAELCKPRLQQDGMFLVGLDIVGDKVMEINVQSPGGVHNAERLEQVPFPRLVIEALERKLAAHRGG